MGILKVDARSLDYSSHVLRVLCLRTCKVARRMDRSSAGMVGSCATTTTYWLVVGKKGMYIMGLYIMEVIFPYSLLRTSKTRGSQYVVS